MENLSHYRPHKLLFIGLSYLIWASVSLRWVTIAHRPLQPGTPDELDRLVHRRVAGNAAEEAELIGAEPQGGENGRIELAHRPLAERLDRMVERALPLHGAAGELPRQRAVALVEALRGSSERAVGVGALLEHAPEHLVGSPARRRDGHRRPRRKAS